MVIKMLEVRKEVIVNGTGYEAGKYDLINNDICIDDLKFVNVNDLEEYLAVETWEVTYDEDGDIVDELIVDSKNYTSVESLAKYLDIDEQVVNSLVEYKAFNKSPYSNSFYNSKDIDWGHKPEGSIRISDHWGFESLGEKHCVIDFEDLTDEDEQEQLNMSWLVCVYKNGKYHILERL